MSVKLYKAIFVVVLATIFAPNTLKASSSVLTGSVAASYSIAADRKKSKNKTEVKSFNILDRIAVGDSVAMGGAKSGAPRGVKSQTDSLRKRGAAVTITDTTGIDSSLRKANAVSHDTLTVSGGMLPLVGEYALEKRVGTIDSADLKRKVEVRRPFSALAMQRSPIFKDTMTFGKVTSLSLIAPGFGQIYNRQYWKLPILYAGVGGFTYAAVHASKEYNNYKELYYSAINNGLPQPEIDALDRKMRNYRTQKILYIAGAAATYMYFVGDAVFNYKGVVHNTRKATVLSAIFPGAGQLYNKSYWKLPIVYGGMATIGYVIDYNNRGYQRYKRAYDAVADTDPGTVDEFKGRIPPEVLANTRDSYRRYRDLGIIIMGGFYLLTIVDAHVEAYLKRYDISDNLAVNVEPMCERSPVMVSRPSSNVFGMTMKLRF